MKIYTVVTLLTISCYAMSMEHVPPIARDATEMRTKASLMRQWRAGDATICRNCEKLYRNNMFVSLHKCAHTFCLRCVPRLSQCIDCDPPRPIAREVKQLLDAYDSGSYEE